MAGDLQTLREKGVFRRSWKFRELQVRDPKKSRNLITVLCCFADGLILAFCMVSGWGWDSTVADNGDVAHCGLVWLETIVMETWERF